MISNLEKAKKSSSIFRALTGISLADFEGLLPTFTGVVHTFLLENKANNQKKTQEHQKKTETSQEVKHRAIGAGPKGLLSTPEAQLFFILVYTRHYFTFELMGFFWEGTSKGRTHDWVMRYLPLLEKTLGYKRVLPERQIQSVAEFIQKFPGVRDYFVDGSERRIQRPKKNKIQKKYYSGKKKTHTAKNGVITDNTRRILVLGKTVEGKKHDSPVVDEMGLGKMQYRKDALGWGDTAFVGFHDILTPKKATKLHPLTEEDKKMNRDISSIRVVVEHAFSYSGWKRFCVVRNTLRSRLYGNFQTVKMNIKDMLAMVAAGLHNLSIG